MSEEAKASTGRRVNDKLLLLIGVSATILIIGFLVAHVDAKSLVRTISGMRVSNLYYAGLVMAWVIVLVGLRWKVTLSATEVYVSFVHAATSILAASALNTVSPSKAGDLIKVYRLKNQAPSTQILGAIVVERLVDAGTLGFLAAVAGILAKQWIAAVIGSALLIVALSSPFVVRFTHLIPLSDNWRNRLNRLTATLIVLKKTPLKALSIIAISFWIWLSMILIAWLLYDGLSADVSYQQVMVGLPVAIIAGIAPITLAGAGTREAALILMMTGAATQAQSLAVGLMYTAIVYWAPALLGAPIVLSSFSHRKVPENHG